ncbi:DNA repair protein RecO [Comamonas flocculans]|uniref:DNA repair protein RecO n=1 Tax=Comamonas flocculans TaxID=2597701 RepID=A0A5B8RU27_9BURK|nr:DNA repair protein RecO [Comamonas flocculans]QEA12174.1 DNA repair protein RecO [Comamonas flocculans]
MATRRITDEPAYILHSHAFSESSLILEVFSRHHGRVALLAKGAKKPTSGFRPVLLSLMPLRLAWGVSPAAEVQTLRAAEWMGGHVMPTGEALLSGLYLNELLLRLLARDDPQPRLFDLYAGAVQLLAASAHGEVLEPALRAFELLLLRALGLLPRLDEETDTGVPLAAHRSCVLVADAGLRPALAGERGALEGERWQQLEQSFGEPQALLAMLRACAPVAAELKPQLRALLQYHCGSPLLRTRQLLMDLQSL